MLKESQSTVTPRRWTRLAVGEIYHIYTRSIADFRIFNDESEYLRMINAIRYYQRERPPVKFSRYILMTRRGKAVNVDGEKLVRVIAYCLMPTHVHLILKQEKIDGISKFMNNTLNSYTRYFNTKHKRKGPLWESRFKDVRVASDEQLLHLTRYVHLNPVTAYIVERPEGWMASSYRDYIGRDDDSICDPTGILDIKPSFYRIFVDEGISYQRELAKTKALLH